MEITVYTFEQDVGEYGSFTTQDYDEAKTYARDNRCRVIANTFEWADSEPLDDFRDTAADADDDSVEDTEHQSETD